MNEIEARAQTIIEAARGEHDPTPDDRARVRSALSAALVPAAGSGTGSPLADAGLRAAEAHATTTTALTTKLLVGGALIGATGLGGGYLALHSVTPTAPPAEAAGQLPRAAPRDEHAPAVPVEAREPETKTKATEPAAPLLPVRTGTATAPALGGAATPGPESSLAQELALLRQAQHALQRNDGVRSLALLDQMVERHPHGVLGEEAAAARVFALCSAGRPREARAQAARFEQQYPESVLAPRVRTACASVPATANLDESSEPTTVQTESLRSGQSGGRLEETGPRRNER